MHRKGRANAEHVGDARLSPLLMQEGAEPERNSHARVGILCPVKVLPGDYVHERPRGRTTCQDH